MGQLVGNYIPDDDVALVVVRRTSSGIGATDRW